MSVTNRIATTHVGSLIRPPELVEMLRAVQRGDAYDARALEEITTRAVNEVVARQAAIGLDIVNDGEFAKTISWSRYVLKRLSGFAQKPAAANVVGMPPAIMGKDQRDFAEFYAEYNPTQNFSGMTGWMVTGPVAYKGHDDIAKDIARLKAAAAGKDVELFIASVAPGSVALDREDLHYKTKEECFYAIADALHEEYRAIVDAGLILQVDDAYLASYYDMMVPPGTMDDYRQWAQASVECLNHALRGIPEERVRYHVCWGSWNAPHVSDVPFEAIADIVLSVRARGYLIEMANPRHEHEWRVWEDVTLPDGKVLIPGVIAHTTNVVEHPKLVAERIVRLARLVGRDNVIAGTDCGFAQGPFTRRVHPSIQWAKLSALVEGARLASAELWGRKAA